MLNWSRAQCTEWANGCFTPESMGRFYSDRFLNLSRITWRESTRRKAWRWWECVTRHTPDFASGVSRRPFDLFSSHQSTSLPARTRKVEELRFRNTLWCPIVRSARLGEPSVNSTGNSLDKRGRKSRGRMSSRYWQCGASLRGTLPRTLNSDRDVLIPVLRNEVSGLQRAIGRIKH